MEGNKFTYEGTDATRHIIKSHGTMLVSIPQEISMRAGLARGVDVRVDQDPANPHVVIIHVINPADRSDDLTALLLGRENRKAKAAAKVEAAAERKEKAVARKAAAVEKREKAAKVRKEKAAKKKAVKKRKKVKAKEASELLAARETKAEELGIEVDLIPGDWRPGDEVVTEPELKPES